MLMTTTSRKVVFNLVDTLELFTGTLGLRGTEVKRLIGVHGGVWPMSPGQREMWWPTDEQSDRIASLCEVLAIIVWLMGPDAKTWVRQRNVGLGCAPISFLLMGRDCVARLRDILRMEQGRC